MKYKEEMSYHEDTQEDMQKVYPQEVMKPDYEETSYEEDTYEYEEEAEEDAYEEDAADQEMTEEPEKEEKPEIKQEHLSGFEYVSLKNSLCREFMGESEGDPCVASGKPCPMQYIDNNGEYVCHHSLIKTEKDYEECERILIEYRNEMGLNKGVLLRYFPGFDCERYLTEAGRAWLGEKYEGEAYE